MFNLLSAVVANHGAEFFETLLKTDSLRIERMVSQGHHSPEGFWYDQLENEWVVLLQGAARLNVSGEVLEMKSGDSVHLPAHCRHRVEWTTPDEATVWLAVFYG